MKLLPLDPPKRKSRSRMVSVAEYVLRLTQPQQFVQRAKGAEAGQAEFRRLVKKEPKYVAPVPFRGVVKLGDRQFCFALDASSSKASNSSVRPPCAGCRSTGCSTAISDDAGRWMIKQAPFPGGPALDAAIEKAIAAGKTPGAVVLAGQPGRVLYRKAYGERAVEPRRERMSEDTIFDAASLTKVIATTSSIMKLFEQGRVRLSDRVTEYLPEFQGGHSTVTVRDLMTHYSGEPPDLKLVPVWSGYGSISVPDRRAAAWGRCYSVQRRIPQLPLARPVRCD